MAAHPHQAKKAKLVIFPGEETKIVTVHSTGFSEFHEVTMGHIYVVNGGNESFDMTGGPRPGHGYKNKEEGGHTAEATPPGHYALDRAEHAVTSSWPKSVIPWGAKLREHGKEVQYQVGSQWYDATGRNGTVTQASLRFGRRSGKHVTFEQEDKSVRLWFYNKGRLLPYWIYNDFGNWAWCLKKNGKRTPFLIHTTPGDEASHFLHHEVILLNSHGCIHIRPSDRDEMVAKGYLKEGVEVEIRKYGEVGPPK